MEILKEIKSLEHSENALHMQRFFKTGAGQYGEGDLFLGINVPNIRMLAKKYYESISYDDIQLLIVNQYHEVRVLALFLMVLKYQKAKSTEEKKNIFDLYIKNIEYINNWDLVDLSAPKIVGHYVYENKNNEDLIKLANSAHLWSERISVVAQYYLIKKGDFSLLLELSEKFLTHKHDLMHKAVGWMLREMGKVDEIPLYKFLDKHHKAMPRTMLRYSIERLTPDKRRYYMAK